MSDLNNTIHTVTQRIIERSRPSRSTYLDLMERERDRAPEHKDVACSNLAPSFCWRARGSEHDEAGQIAQYRHRQRL